MKSKIIYSIKIRIKTKLMKIFLLGNTATRGNTMINYIWNVLNGHLL